MEKQLKKDVLAECHIPSNRSNIIVHNEAKLHSVSFLYSYHSLYRQVLHVNAETLLTTRELFYLVGIKGYDIKYYRIPIIESNPPSLVESIVCFTIGCSF